MPPDFEPSPLNCLLRRRVGCAQETTMYRTPRHENLTSAKSPNQSPMTCHS